MNLNNVSQTLRLREYYYMLLRHKGTFVVTVCLSMIIAVTLAFTQPKIYRAESVLLVKDDKILNPLISGLAISPSVAARMRTLREELLSWSRLTLLAEKLGLDKKVKNPVQYEGMIKNLRKDVDIHLKGHSLITVSYEGKEPRKAQEIVKTLSDIIIEGNITSVDLEANSAIRFINEQLNQYRAGLEKSEKNLREYRELYNSILPVATRMNEQIVQMRVELSNLLVENTEMHPRVIQLRKQIDQLTHQRDEFMQKAQKSGLDINTEDYAKLVSSVPLQEQQMAKLQRDYNVNESIYQKLLQRLETAKISQTLEKSENGTTFKVLEPARLPLKPIKPNKLLYLIGGLMAGFGFGILLIYVLEMMNNSIRSLDEARQLLDLPIFGAISTIRPQDLILQEKLRAETHV